MRVLGRILSFLDLGDINLIVSTYNSVTKCVWPSLSYLRDLICPVIPTKVPWSVYDSIFVAVLPNALQKYNHKLFHYFHLYNYVQLQHRT